MLHILFLVLKIIGIILLVILGILILLLCMVLFIPANYQIQAETDDGVEQLSVEAKAHWLLHLVSAYYIYKDKKADWQVRIAWKKMNRKDAIKSEDKQQSATEKCVQGTERSKDEVTPQNVTQEKAEQKQKQSLFEKIKCTIIKICDKIKSFRKTKEKISAFLTDEVHVEAFKIIKTEIGILAKHLRPRKIHGFVRFGFEDPYKTGQVLAALSVLYPFYGDNINLYPDFESQVLEGDLHTRGHIRLVHLVALIWNLFFNDKVRKTYKDYQTLKS